jgi:glycosyltransferase involved in cell wall biosynthesis
MTHRYHILGLPHTVTSPDYSACAYTQKVLKFAKMMKARGHEVIHYGHERSVVDCTEHITVSNDLILKTAYGDHDWRRSFFKFDVNDAAYKCFYAMAAAEVARRKKPGDFLLCFFGHGHKPVADAHPDMIVMEPGIGYAGGFFARFKAFESYALMHAYHGLAKVGQCGPDFYETVIPNYFDPAEFTYREQKQDHFLYLGRVYNGKGVNVAIEVTKAIGAKLVIAGQLGDDYKDGKFPAHVEFVGYADPAKRRELMANARASFLPSMYVEPFGGVQVENLLSGTPTITSDWGAFAENNIHGKTGYRCRTFDQFCWAASNIDRIKPADCRAQGERFTLERIAPLYEEFSQMASDVQSGKGWYERHPDRTDIHLGASHER